jgi:heptosyltransferase I
VDRRDAAARRWLGRPAAELGWRTAVTHRDAMSLIEVEAVVERLDAAMAFASGRR